MIHDQSPGIKDKFKGRSNIDLPTSPRSRLNQQEIKSFTCFGIVESESFIRRFKLCFRDGRKVSIPYATLPIIELKNDGELILTTSEFIVRFSGRGLSKLEQWLSEEKVTWIKQSPSGHDDETSATFIATIQIEDV